jgi:tight adherence protein B
MTEQIVIIVVGVAVLLAANGIYYFVMYIGQRQRTELRRRLRSLSAPVSKRMSLIKERRIARIPFLDRLLRPIGVARRMEQLLLQTDLTWTVAQVIGIGVLLGTALTVGLALILHKIPALALVGFPLGMSVPFLIVVNSRIKRNEKISQQLPDALEMMVRSLRAGHGINSGFKLVAGEMPAPIAVEFGRCFEEQQFGVDFRDAIQHMTERVPKNLDLKIFAVSIVIQRETGGNLVEILEQIATTVRERFKFYGKLRSLTAEGKYSGYILGALPFLCLMMVGLFRPAYLVPLFTDPIGWVIGLGGLAMWALGVLWMKALVKVDY